MSGVGEAVVQQQPDGAVGVPVASAATSIPSADQAPAISRTLEGASIGPAVSPAAASVAVNPSLNAQIMAPTVLPGAAGAATIAPSPTQITAAVGNTAISIVSVPANSIPAPQAPGQEVAVQASSVPPVETNVPAPAETAVEAPSATLEQPPAQAPAPAASSPPVESPPVEYVAPPAESSPVPSLAPPAVSSDSIPSAIGDANIFAPAESQASESAPEQAAVSSSSSNPPADTASAIESSSSSASQPSSADTAAAASSSSSAKTSQASAQANSSSSSRTTGSSTILSVSAVSGHTSNQISAQFTASEKTEDKPPVEATSNGQESSEAAKPTTSAGKDEPAPDTTFVSGSVTFTGAAAVSGAEFSRGGETTEAKDGMSSFAIIGIVGGILVFFIILYIAWFQWRKRRSRDEPERLEDEDTYDGRASAFDPYGLANEKHSGFDFIDQPLSSRRSQKHRTGVTTMYTENPFADQNEQYQRRLEDEYVETWYSDPGEAGLGTARSKSMKWYEDDRRPSYIDGPRSIYHDQNDPSDPVNQYSPGQSPIGDEREYERERDRPSSVPATARTNPGAPPVPPLPAAYRESDPHSIQSQSRPQTNFTYGDYLTGYDTATSRPATQYTHDNPPQTSSTMMDSPNTAAMLPWLHSDRDDAPPMPQAVHHRSGHSHHAQGQAKNGFGSPPRMPLRGPVAAAMAQTPQMEDRGYQGVIPSFR